MNHCGTHKYSSYCPVITIMKVLHNIYKYKHVKDADIVTANFIPYAKLKIPKCRMDYGKARIFDSSGENKLTRGVPILLFSKIICDSNGQHRYHCWKNHPRILVESYSFLYYGGNKYCIANTVNNFGKTKIYLNTSLFPFHYTR